MRLAVLWLPVFGAAELLAQDAAMVRAASRAFETQIATLHFTAGQHTAAERLSQDAEQEAQAGRFGEALRRYAHATAVLRDAPWTPAIEFVASLQGRIDRAMVDPGQPVTISLVPLFPSKPALGTKAVASIFLTPAGDAAPTEIALARGAIVEASRLPFTARIAAPTTAAGNYHLEVRLGLVDGSAPEALRDVFRKSLPIHIEALSREAQQLRDRLAAFARRDEPALPSAEYVLTFYERADRGEEGPRRYQNFAFRREFAAAQAILDELEAGRDPFAGKHGDFRKAYRSAVDRTLQPYRIFIPREYDGAHPTPLVLALHGAGGDENDMFDGFPGAALVTEAERVGLIVACPKGRGPNSGYRGAAERDVLDVLAQVRRDYRIDPGRIYLMGHSMGGYATWRLAMKHPDLFAALGPIAGGGNPSDMVKLRSIPQYVVHGAEDRTVPVTESRAMVEAGRRAGANIVYVEVPGAGHYEAVRGQFGPMLDFFVKQSRSAAASDR